MSSLDSTSQLNTDDDDDDDEEQEEEYMNSIIQNNENSSIMDNMESEQHSYESDQHSYESDDLYDEIQNLFRADSVFLDSVRHNNKYYIGACYQISEITSYKWIVGTCVSPTAFFRFSYETVLDYLQLYSIYYTNQYNDIEIFQIYIEDNNYYAIIKTFWLRLVQRFWKKIFAQRKKIIEKRCSIKSQYYFQINGKYPVGLNYLPEYKNILQN